MKRVMFLILTLFLFAGIGYAEDSYKSINTSSYKDLSSVKIAAYSYKISDKLGDLSVDTVKNSINAKNFLLDCQGKMVCDYRVEITAKQALAFDIKSLSGAYIGEGVSVDTIFYEQTISKIENVCVTVLDNNSGKNNTACQDITTKTVSENKDILKPFSKDEVRTYVIRFRKDNTVNADGTHRYNNKIVDVYHVLFGQERKDAAYWNSSGGTVSYDGNYTVVTFLANGSFNVTGIISNATILVVAGGGGGASGGGGAGGLNYSTNINLTGNYSIIIGSGGAYGSGYAVPGTVGSNGSNSSLSNSSVIIINTMGGGASGGSEQTPPIHGFNGGSGGGGAYNGAFQTFGGFGTVGQGNDGGGNALRTGSPYPAGGGGGAGGVGGYAIFNTQAGNGGIGLNFTISGTNTNYSCGGGGAVYGVGTGGIGGCNSAGIGGAPSYGTNASANSGSGGGGGSNGKNGGNGGSGIIIIRYLTYIPYPGVQLVAPGNNSIWDASSQVNFTYNVSDGISISFCNLSVNGSILNSSSSIVIGINQTLYADLLNGAYNWSVNCTGQSGYMNWSDTYNVLVATTISLTRQVQVPADITSLSMFLGRANITYLINATEGVDNGSVNISYKVNNTYTDTLRFINGTGYGGYRNVSYESALGNNYTFTLGDAKVYPYTENLDFLTYFRNSNHNKTTLTAANQLASVELINISTNKTYSYFEIMLNSTVNLTLPVYYCNSSFAFSNSPAGNPSCTNFNTIQNTNNYTHCHNTSAVNSSCHHVLAFAINSTTSLVGSVKVTEKGYFIVRGLPGATINIWMVNNESRTGATKTSANNGNTWTNQTYTIDAHLHQFSDNDSIYYYACANDTNGLGNCSVVSQDLIGLAGLPPSTPGIYSPNATTYYNVSIWINYTAAASPNGYEIIQYNISLYNETYDLLSVIQQNNSVNLSYYWNTSTLDAGNYSIGVTACDNLTQCSTGFSDIFQFLGVTTTSTTTTTELTTTTTTTTIPTTTLPSCGGNLTADCTTYDLNQAECISHYWNFINDYYPCVYNVSSDLCSYNASDPCSPTTTTTTTTSTTSTTIPVTVSSNSTLYIFTILAPLLAVIFTLAAIFGGSKIGILPSVFASTLWYASSMFTTRIRFIDNFTISGSTHYIDVGNWEVGSLFLAFAAIMALYTVVLVLDFVYSSSRKQNG